MPANCTAPCASGSRRSMRRRCARRTGASSRVVRSARLRWRIGTEVEYPATVHPERSAAKSKDRKSRRRGCFDFAALRSTRTVWVVPQAEQKKRVGNRVPCAHNPDMPTALLESLLELSSCSGDSAAALRALAQHFAHLLPGCHVALILVRDQPPGTARLAGLVEADGTEHLPNQDPFNELGQLARFDDTLCRTLFGWTAPQRIHLAPRERSTPLAQALLAPAAIFATPIVNAGAVSHWLVFASGTLDRFDNADVEHLVVRANLAANLVIRQVIVTNMTAEATRQRAEIEGLAAVQKLLQPDSPRIRGLEYAVHWQPADTAAGDYYDLSNLSWIAAPPLAPGSDDLWALMLAAVSGHGAAAAMEGAQFDAILRTYRGDEPPGGPAGAITSATRYLFSRPP